MMLLRVLVTAARITRNPGGRGHSRSRSRSRARRGWRRGRLLAAAGLGPILAAGTCVAPAAVPVAAAAGAAAAAVAVGVATAAPAKAAGGQPVLVLVQNGETTAPESTLLQNAGYAVTQVTPSTWAGMSASQFESYAALVIGDPSSAGSCSTSIPTTGTLGTIWQGAVNGNLAVLGTAPALPGTTAANTLITDAAGYAAAGFNSANSGTSTSGTGLYESLNCEYSTASAGTAVPLLAGVEGIGTAGGLTVQGGLSCSDPGTVNTWEADKAGTFGGFTSSSLAAGQWSPGCPVQEAFDSWPAMFTPVSYDAASDAAANFTASDGVTGQPYVLLGAPVSAATAALAPSSGGEVLAGTTTGGTSNPAAPGVSQASAGDPVNTENGDFTQSNTDFSIPTFGPSLGFTRTYDAGVAEQQTKAGTPGPMGYGWTDNWATSLSTVSPTPGDIYAAGGLRTGNGNNGPAAQSVLSKPGDTYVDGSGDVYIADAKDNRVQEIAGSTGTQWGISMTAGDVYTVAGSPQGYVPNGSGTANGTPAAQTLLNHPTGVTANGSGLYIADTTDCRVVEIAAANQTQWGITMTAGDEYTIAGTTGSCGTSGDGGPATSAQLYLPTSIHLGAGSHAGDLYIADTGNNRIQEIAAAGENEWGKQMSANDIYTVAGSPAGGSGMSSNGTAAGSTLLNAPAGVTIDGNDDMLIADTSNCRIAEIPWSSGTYWGITGMTGGHLYDVAGRGGSNNCTIGYDNKSQLQSNLNYPDSVRDPNGNMYIADAANNRVQEVAGTAHTEWGQNMTANFVYTIAGNSNGTAGNSGNGGTGLNAYLTAPGAIWLDSTGNLYVSDTGNNALRELAKSTDIINALAGTGYTLLNDGDGGPAVMSALLSPQTVASDAHGDIFIADTANNRIQEIAASSHTQFGIVMTAGDIYTVAGSSYGQSGYGGDGGPATSALLFAPTSVAVDSSGNLYIADESNSVIREVSAATGDISTIAGMYGAQGYYGDGGPATSAVLGLPDAVAVDRAGDVFLADGENDLIQEIPAASGTYYGISMTAGDIYAIAGIPQQAGDSGDGGPGSSALLAGPEGLAVDAAGNVYLSDTVNNQVREVAAANGTQWAQAMTAGDIYTIAGNTSGTVGNTGDAGPAASAQLDNPIQIALDTAGDLYIADTFNNRIREIAAANGTQQGQSMTAGDIYNVAGQASSAGGFSGNGGPATAASLSLPFGIGTDPAGDLFVLQSGPSWAAGQIQEVTATATSAIPAAPGQTSSVSPAPGGITITQPGGSQITFYAQSGGGCAAPYIAAGQYCALPQFTGATLTDNTGNQTYSYSTGPGSETDTYSWTGHLISETDTAGNTLAITYNSPAPGSGSCPSTATSCETVTAANGRALVIGSNIVNGSSLVTSVADPLGRTWSYGYNSSSQLASATDPMTNKTTYTYGQGSTANPLLASDLLTITGPNAQPGGPDAGDATSNVYDALGRVTSQTDPMGFKTTFNYCVNQAAGNCMDPATGTGYVTVTDPDGNTTVSSYQQGELVSQTIWNGTTPSEQDFGPVMTATGNAAGTLLDVWTDNAEGNRTSFTYDQAAHIASIVDPLGNTTTMYSTTLGGASCSADPLATTACSANQTGPSPVTPGQTISPPASVPPAGVSYTQYDTDGHALYSTTGVYEPGSSTASSEQTSYALYAGNSINLNGTNISCAAPPPSASLPCAQIDAAGQVTQYGYDSAGDLISESTPDGNGSQLATQTYAYDGDGERTSATSPDGNVSGGNAGNYTTTTAYNADGQQTSVTNAGGTGATVTPRTTSYGYDGDGNRVSVKDARGYTTAAGYDADDDATTVTDPDGNTSLTCYDGDGHLVQTVPPTGVAVGHLTSSSCPSSYPSGYTTRLAADATTYTYNATGQDTAETYPAPAGQTGYETTTYAYNADGLPVQVTSPPTTNGGPNQVTVDTYNADDQVGTQTTGYGTSAASTVSYCYDPEGKKTAEVAPDGNTGGVAPCETSAPWAVNSSSYPAQAAYQTTNSYDSTGQLVATTSPATAAAPHGATTAYTYDTAGNLLTSTDPDGVITTMTYDTPGGHVSGINYSGSSAHSVSYTYDADGNRTGMVDGTGTSSYIYDPFGELTSATNGAGATVGYSYDADGHKTGITYPLPPSASWASTDTVSHAYDKAGNLTSVTDFNNHQTTITPNSDSVPSSITLGSTGDTISYTYDQADQPSVISLSNGTATLQSFSYANAPAGDILSETDVPTSPSSPATYTYDAQDRVTSMTPGSNSQLNYGFDASGNLTGLPTGATATYDNDSELTSSTLSGTTTGYTYNADGERLTATQGTATIASGTWNGAGQLTAYNSPAADMTAASYDGTGLRAASTTGSGTQQFAWDDSSHLLMDSSNAYIYANGTAPTEQVSLSSGAVSYLDADALGSVRGVVSSSGSLTASTSYDAWGNPQTVSGLTNYTPFGYAGGYTDPTGLIYLINRYYDPSTGQFLSVDPEVAQTGEPYGYAKDDPVSEADPDGLSPWAIAIPSTQSPTSSEAQFEIWVSNILGGPTLTHNQWTVEWLGNFNYSSRRVDAYFWPTSSFGWLNEVKVGPTSNDKFTKSEADRDRHMIAHPRDFCHYVSSRFGCLHFPINGATWWFRYKSPAPCQMPAGAYSLCSTLPLFGNLFTGNPGINQIYVDYYPQDRNSQNIYDRNSRKIRNAVESNRCPVEQIKSTGLRPVLSTC